MPEKATALAEQLDAYLAQVDAQLPAPNPDYDATAEAAGPSSQRGRRPGRVRPALRGSR